MAYHDPIVTPDQLALELGIAGLVGGLASDISAVNSGKDFLTGEALPEDPWMNFKMADMSDFSMTLYGNRTTTMSEGSYFYNKIGQNLFPIFGH